MTMPILAGRRFLLDTISCGARKSVTAHGLHRPTHERPAATSPIAEPTQRWCSDCGKGRAKRDGQERADRPTTSLRALGLWKHRSGTQAEKATTPVTLPTRGQI
jgi:hypothetical protein